MYISIVVVVIVVMVVVIAVVVVVITVNIIIIIIIIIIITYLQGNFWQYHSERGQAAKRKLWGLTIYPREISLHKNNNGTYTCSSEAKIFLGIFKFNAFEQCLNVS